MLRRLLPLVFGALPALALAQEPLVVWNWNDYIAPQILKDFEKETGTPIQYHTFSSMEELEQALQSGEPIDIAVPSHDRLPLLIKAGRLQPLSPEQLSNRGHLDKTILSKLAAFDPKNQYAIPYLWGAIGLAVNTPMTDAALGGSTPQSWSLLFDPEQSAKLANCGISLLDSSNETMAILLNYQGRTLARSSPKQLQRAGDVLNALRPKLRYIDSERYISDLSNGKLCLSVAWIGDALAAADSGQPVRFIVPEEGSTLFIDNMVIPSTSKQPAQAHRFIDYMLRPQVAALLSSEVLYPNPNKDSGAFMDDNLRLQLTQVDEAKRRLFALVPLPDKLENAKEKVWTDFKGSL